MQRYQHGGNVWDKQQPLQWLDFSANINPWGPPPEMLQAIADALPTLHRYPDPQAKAATMAVADYLRVPEENLLLTNGGLAGLDLLVAHLRPETTVFCQPTFVEYERLTELHGVADRRHLLCWHERQDWRVPEEALRQAPAGSLVFLCNPSNPCGAWQQPPQVERLLQLLSVRSARLVLDEAFVDFIPGASLRQRALRDDHLVIAGSLTKLFAIPGLRLGYLVGSADLIGELRRRQTPWSLNLLAQEAAKTLPNLTHFVQRSLEQTAEARMEMTAGLSDLGIVVHPSQVNFLLLDLRPIGLTAANVNRLLAPAQMQLRDCSNFVGLDAHFARVAVLRPDQNRLLLNALRQTIASVKHCPLG